MCDLKDGKIKPSGEIGNKILLSKGQYLIRNKLNREENYKDLKFELKKNKNDIDYIVWHTKKKLGKLTFNY